MGKACRGVGEKLETLVRAYSQAPTESLLQDIVQAAQKLVRYFARAHVYSSCYEDLLQAGFEGLIKALNNFDVDKDVRFSTYAAYYIKGEIYRELQRANAYDKPLWLAEIQNKIKAATDELRQTLQREPSLAEIAAVVNIEEKGVSEALQAGCVPLEELDLSKIRNLRYESFQLPIEDRLLLWEALGSLNKTQQKVVYLIFYHGLPQVKVAEILGTNQRKVSRLLRGSLEQISLHVLG